MTNIPFTTNRMLCPLQTARTLQPGHLPAFFRATHGVVHWHALLTSRIRLAPESYNRTSRALPRPTSTPTETAARDHRGGTSNQFLAAAPHSLPSNQPPLADVSLCRSRTPLDLPRPAVWRGVARGQFATRLLDCPPLLNPS
eukprot:798254-Rhodomonas_salina.1